MLWIGRHSLNWKGKIVNLVEKFYFATVNSLFVSIDSMTDEEQEVYRGHKWWSLKQIEDSKEIFVLKDLGILLRPIINGELPKEIVAIDMDASI